jgi:hypothetical protein
VLAQRLDEIRPSEGVEPSLMVRSEVDPYCPVSLGELDEFIHERPHPPGNLSTQPASVERTLTRLDRWLQGRWYVSGVDTRLELWSLGVR